MLTEILKASVKTKREEKPDRAPGISCSSLFPCPYRLYKVHVGEVWDEELTAQQVLNMEDGWDQEEQSIKRLRKANIGINDRQTSILVGKSNIPGHIDGTVTLGKVKRLWEHKAWNASAFGWFISRGITYRPGEKAQINAYMWGMGLDECIFMVKNKDNNDYHDSTIPYEKGFILPIIEWADKIRLEGWVPEPKLCKYCAYCYTKCFGEVIDFSWIKEAKAPEMAKRWRDGYKLTSVGEVYMQEARTFFTGQVLEKSRQVKKFPGLIGDDEFLLVEGLKIKKTVQHRFDISKARVIQEFGPEGLMKVGKENDIDTYRIQEA